MNLPLVALFSRSLREDVHSKGTYWARAALGAFILLMLAAVAQTGNWLGAPGRSFFIALVILQIIAITLIGLSHFTSAVAEEKEEQTLGLLRLTDLNPLSILLGKSTSRLCVALLLLAAVFPFTVFTVTLGGISLGQITAAYCTLGAYTFLLCNVALLGSVVARRTPGAAGFTILVMGALLGSGPLLSSLHGAFVAHGWKSSLDHSADLFWKATPIARLTEVLQTGFAGAPVGWQVEINLMLGVLCFLLSWVAFDRFCDRAPAEAATATTGPWRFLRFGARRPRRPNGDALVWKDFHFLYGGRIGLIARLVFYASSPLLALVGMLFSDSSGGKVTGLALPFLSLSRFLFTIDLGWMAAVIFRSELNGQTFSALAGLPLTIRQIAYRKTRALLLVAAPGAAFMIAGAFLQASAYSAASASYDLRLMMLLQSLASCVGMVLLAHIVAWLSLSMKRGALPVGYVAYYGFNMVMMILWMFPAAAGGFIFRGGMFSSVVLMPLLSAVASLVAALILHRLILRKLETLTGEG